MSAIIAYDLSKKIDAGFMLSGISIEVKEAETFAVIGKENSGKTTLLRILAGLSSTTAGECKVMGFSPVYEPAKLHALVGVVVDSAKLYVDKTITENLNLFADLNGVDKSDANDRISFLLRKLNIWEERDDIIKNLPTGIVYRVSIARALIHSPKVMLLDEPTGGMNLETIGVFKELIPYLTNEEGMTVVMFTGNMDHAGEFCYNFAILDNGALVSKGDLESLRQRVGLKYKVSISLKEDEILDDDFEFVDGTWQKEIESEDEVSDIISDLVKENKTMYEVKIIKPTIKDVYDAYFNRPPVIIKGGEVDEQSTGAEITDSEEPVESSSEDEQE